MKTRRERVLSGPQKFLRTKQIERVQEAREEEIQQLARTFMQPRNRQRPHWTGPSIEKQERLAAMLHRDDRLRSKGKGCKTRRRL